MTARLNETYVLGKRIVIYGATGSGKSTLADRLGEALGVGVMHLDNIRHERGWDSVDWDEMRGRMEAFIAAHPEGWVSEGNYSRVRDVTLSQADTLISLDVPWRTSFVRLLKRTVVRAIDQKPLYNDDGPHESWRGSFMSRQSILLWSVTNHRRRKRTTAEAFASKPEGARTYRLRTSREVEALVAAAKVAGARTLEAGFGVSVASE
jgi:adenylate kinase family enzyme